jgi:pseudouridine-5'-phosphate glycosidase
VVALESTVISHGLPRPINLDTARAMEATVHEAGVQPATVGILKGLVRLGFSPDELEELALSTDTIKVNRRDFSAAVVNKRSGGTTVSGTMIVAHAAGVPLFATGGIGGVHRGESGDISADLPELAQTPVVVVCSGAKSILDLPRTLEWLETHGVPVIGWGCDSFPAFFSQDSGLAVSTRVDTVAEAAQLIRSHWTMGFESGILVCVPCPEDAAIPMAEVETTLEEAEEEAEGTGISGKDLTPFLLTRLAELTGGRTLHANLALLKNNARVAAEIAKGLASKE